MFEREVIPEPKLDKNKIALATAVLVQEIHSKWAISRGWWDDLKTGERLDVDYPAGERPKGSKAIGEIVSLIHSEISEAYEGHRKNKMDDHLPQFTSFEVELADAMIRILDAAGGLNLRLEAAMAAKMEYNWSRADHSHESRKKDDGKKT